MSGKDQEYRIFVGGLSWDITECQIEDAFSRFGKVTDSQNKCEIGAQGFINHEHIMNNVSDPALTFASRYADTKPVIPLINGQKAEPE